MSALRVLAAIFDVDTGKATAKVDTLETKFDGIKKTLSSVGSALAGAFTVAAIGSLINEQIELGSVINDTAEKLGVGTDELQKFQYAAGLTGVSSESAAQALGFLSKNVGEALGGSKEAVQTFSELGIALKDGQGGVRELGDLLPEVADAFEKMGSNEERTATSMKLFGKSGAALIPLLKQGSAELESMSKAFDALGGGLSEDFIKKADEAGDRVDDLKFSFRGLKSQLVGAILPGFTDLTKKATGIVSGLRRMMRETDLAKYAWAAMGAVSAASSVKAAFSFGKLLGLIPKDAGFWKSALGLGVWGLVAAAVVGFGLILEDLWKGIQGGQSVIREWLDETLGVQESTQFFEMLRQTVDQVKGAFSGLGPELKPILSDLMKMAVEAGPGIAQAFVFVVKVIAAAVRGLAGFAQTIGIVVGAVAKLVGGDNSGIDSLGKDLGKSIDATGNAIWGKGGLFGDQTPTVPGMIGPPAPSGGGAAGAPMAVKFEVGDINVNGGPTNADTGRAVKNALNDTFQAQMQGAAAALKTGR